MSFVVTIFVHPHLLLFMSMWTRSVAGSIMLRHFYSKITLRILA